MAHKYAGQLIPSDGLIQDVAPKGVKWALTEWQTHIGGYVEVVRTSDPRWVMLVDEEGRVRNRVYNHRATLIAGQPIFGPMLVLPASVLDDDDDDDDACARCHAAGVACPGRSHDYDDDGGELDGASIIVTPEG